MRNFISHEYANIDEEIVYDVTKEDLPKMQKAVKEILLNLNSAEDKDIWIHYVSLLHLRHTRSISSGWSAESISRI